MKRAAAIVLSLMFVWLQVTVSAQTSFLQGANGCRCCACKRTACCVTEAPSNAQTPIALPATAGITSDFSLFAPMLLTWTLPVTSCQISPSDSAPLPALAVPLFTRHCTLLI